MPKWFITKYGGDNSHWCCTNEQAVNFVQRTKIGKDIHIESTKVKSGYTKCGFGGLSMYLNKLLIFKFNL